MEALAARDRAVARPAIDMDSPADKALAFLDRFLQGEEVGRRLGCRAGGGPGCGGPSGVFLAVL